MLKGLKRYLPEKESEFDVQLQLTLTCSYRKSHLAQLYNPVFLNTNIRCDSVAKDHDMEVSFRITCITLDDGSLEYLMSNLPVEEFSSSRFKAVYFRCWNEEQGFRSLKLHLSMISFHAKTKDSICKEIYAGLTMFNYCSHIISLAAVKVKKSAYMYVINWSCAITLIRKLLTSTDAIDIITLIGKQLTPLRPNRKYKRNKIPRKPVNCYYRTA